MLKNKTVLWFTDSQNCVKVINSGSFKKQAVDIFRFCAKNNISLDMQWIPRDQNETADIISKCVDYDDWGVSDEFFKFMNQMWALMILTDSPTTKMQN